jgi:hypothetical protein
VIDAAPATGILGALHAGDCSGCDGGDAKADAQQQNRGQEGRSKQQRCNALLAARVGIAAAAAAEDHEDIGFSSHSSSDSEGQIVSGDCSSGGSDTEGATEQQGTEECRGGSSLLELGALDAQAQHLRGTQMQAAMVMQAASGADLAATAVQH